MSKKIDRQVEKLQGLRLPELQAKFAEIVGEPTRAPNKTYLLRRIREALEAKAPKAKKAKTTEAPETKRKREPSGLTKLTVEELQQRYLQEVGRPTESDNKGYLIWKIRQARKGKVRVGPARERKHDAGTTQVVPLTLPRTTVAELDKVVERTDHKSRSDLLKRAIHDYLRIQGFGPVARLFEDA
jgi:hypothetical protein